MREKVESHERGIAVISEKLDLLLRGQARMATELTDGPRSPIGRSVQPPIGSSGAGSHNRDETGGYGGRRPEFRPRNIELPLFAGSDPDDWTYRAERYFGLQRLTAEEQLEAAVLCLEGPALRWFRWENRRREIRSWGELKDLLLRRFLPAHEGSAYDRFLALQQTSTVQEYRQQFEALTASLGAVAEPLLESAFLKGLNSEIQGTLRLLEPVGLEKTMELAEIVEANPKVVRAFGSGPSKGVSGLESLIYLFVCTTTSTHWMDLLHLQQFLKSKQHESPQETIQALDIVLRDAPSKVGLAVMGGEGDCFDVGRSGEFEHRVPSDSIESPSDPSGLRLPQPIHMDHQTCIGLNRIASDLVVRLRWVCGGGGGRSAWVFVVVTASSGVVVAAVERCSGGGGSTWVLCGGGGGSAWVLCGGGGGSVWRLCGVWV
ncbi:hypothetical protein F8388_020377 [Cannabis sativa]|uniref:Retrotransposon gag domain-containing protein n=1 Tax=Cannabis sativa TaxID=3483 RepID=A0A7J6GB68_CANSA|nr:hypothetical protein G4B88_005652 [Cannabis sativa]KAF4394552.1 hypothetical protein F8388_020377 [Cannabis sativa]